MLFVGAGSEFTEQQPIVDIIERFVKIYKTNKQSIKHDYRDVYNVQQSV